METLNGESVDVMVSGEGALMLNGANAIQEDIIASNGIVHVIDEVLLPPTRWAPTSTPSSMPTRLGGLILVSRKDPHNIDPMHSMPLHSF